jgi:hypothetical protein
VRREPTGYFRDLVRLGHRTAAPLGVLLIFLSLPGLLGLLFHDDWSQALPWLPGALFAFSSLLFAVGMFFLWQGLRRALRFGLPLRSRARHGL